MTIQDFSKRTGISKSTLRFYETEKLLCSIDRNSSGYRVYSEEQVSAVNVISSLRLADIPIKDIKMYLDESSDNGRIEMKEQWIHSLQQKRDVLEVGLRYLGSNPLEEEIHLMDKKPEKIIWFSAESKKGQFKSHFLKRSQELGQLQIPTDSWYLKYESGNELIKAQIGFGVPSHINVDQLSEIEVVEEMDGGIYLAMPFNDSMKQIQNGYRKLMTYAVQHEWIPRGSLVEWYRGKDYMELDLIMSVTQIKERGGVIIER